MEKRFAVSKCDAIKIMRTAIKNMECMDDNSIFVLSIDLEGDGISDRGIHMNIEGGTNIINKSETRVFSGNRYISQLDLYSVKQPDIENIRREGVMKTILFPGI